MIYVQKVVDPSSGSIIYTIGVLGSRNWGLYLLDPPRVLGFLDARGIW